MAKNIRGEREVKRNLDRALERYRKAIVAGTTEVAAEVTGIAQKDAPVKTGALRASGSFFVDGDFVSDTGPGPGGSRPANRRPGSETKKVPGTVRAVVGFNMVYAAVQHEETAFRHPQGGKAKYLEGAVTRVFRKVRGVFTASIKAVGF